MQLPMPPPPPYMSDLYGDDDQETAALCPKLSDNPQPPPKPPTYEELMKMERGRGLLSHTFVSNKKKDPANTSSEDTHMASKSTSNNVSEEPVATPSTKSKKPVPEPKLRDKVDRNGLVKYIAYEQQCSIEEAETTLDAVEKPIRKLCAEGKQVQFLDGMLRTSHKPASVKLVGVPPNAPEGTQPRNVLINKHDVITYRPLSEKRLGVEMWDCTVDATNGNIKLAHRKKPFTIDSFVATEDDIKAWEKSQNK
jgi:hypothetical protein